MILRITLHQEVDLALFPLIEKLAPIYLPVTKISGYSYWEGHRLASQLGMTPEQLLKKASDSNYIHAVALPSGAFYLHPVGIKKMIAKRAKHMLRSMIKLQ